MVRRCQWATAQEKKLEGIFLLIWSSDQFGLLGEPIQFRRSNVTANSCFCIRIPKVHCGDFAVQRLDTGSGIKKIWSSSLMPHVTAQGLFLENLRRCGLLNTCLTQISMLPVALIYLSWPWLCIVARLRCAENKPLIILKPILATCCTQSCNLI